MKKVSWFRSKGSVVDLVIGMITILAIVVIVTVSISYTELMLKKLEISQIARQYILLMETKGYMDNIAEQQLYNDLQSIGLENIELKGTTKQAVQYGDMIVLCICGELRGDTLENDFWSNGLMEKRYHVEEKRVSTAKN